MKSATRSITLAWLAAASAWSSAADAAAAWSFIPTPLEWNAWPEYCRVQFTLHGEVLPYEGYENARLGVAVWRETIGQNSFIHLHHFCAGLHYRTRSLAEPNLRERTFLLSQAWEEGTYTYTRIESSSVIYPVVSVGVAQIRMDMGRTDEAIDILKKSIKAQPKALDPYVMLAIIHRRKGELDDALAIMQTADQILDGKSVEVQYTMGLINFDKGNLEAAAENARRAYEMGYPLPGLREMLRTKGHWPPKPRAGSTESTATTVDVPPAQPTDGDPPD